MAMTCTTLAIVEFSARFYRLVAILVRVYKLLRSMPTAEQTPGRSCSAAGEGKQQPGTKKGLFHGRLFASLPNCATSYETPNRSRSRALVSVMPKAGENVNLVPLASVHPTVGPA